MSNATKETLHFDKYSKIGITDNVPYSFPEHWHMDAELLFIQGDGCEFLVDHEKICPKKGDIVLIWPFELHSTFRCPKGSCRIIQVDPDLIRSFHDIYMYYHKLTGIRLISSNEEDVRVKLNTLSDAIFTFDRDSQMFAETKINVVLSWIFVTLTELAFKKENIPDDIPAANTETFLKIKSACTYITSHCAEPISQNELSEMTGFSPYYFSRVFRKYTHQSFNEYLNAQRIRLTLEFLRTGAIPITDVAFAAGFQSISNFNKVFKKYMGVSPSEYQKLHIEE